MVLLQAISHLRELGGQFLRYREKTSLLLGVMVLLHILIKEVRDPTHLLLVLGHGIMLTHVPQYIGHLADQTMIVLQQSH
jgi:hypothetical protein